MMYIGARTSSASRQPFLIRSAQGTLCSRTVLSICFFPFNRFMRRLALSTIPARVRAYTEYNFHYPVWEPLAAGLPAFYFIGFINFLFMGSVVKDRHQKWKKWPLRGMKRRMGTGYGWSRDFPGEIKSIYRNIPVAAK